MRKEEIINGLRTLRGELANNYKDNQRIGFIAGVNRAIEFIHSTDEPEVLSQKFINEKAVEVYADTADAEVHAVFRMRDLQTLLVPTLSKTETVADVIADFYKSLERLKEVMSMEVEEMEE